VINSLSFSSFCKIPLNSLNAFKNNNYEHFQDSQPKASARQESNEGRLNGLFILK
jgi:hypothetical protein